MCEATVVGPILPGGGGGGGGGGGVAEILCSLFDRNQWTSWYVACCVAAGC